MNIEGWKYYNHAAIPITPINVNINSIPVADGSVWKIGGGIPLLARWTSDWDCGFETDFWYVIKDTPLDVENLKAKRRYEIRKGERNFYITRIIPENYVDEIVKVTLAAYKSWPKQYRPTINPEMFKRNIIQWNKRIVFGAFDRENEQLEAYAVIDERDGYADFSSLRANPEVERLGVNAAIVAGILKYYHDQLNDGYFICDGSRSINHDTAFQDYLEKYFGFRKAYCHLNIKYRCVVGLLVSLVYPLRRMINHNSKLGSQILGILRLEEIRRSQNKEECL